MDTKRQLARAVLAEIPEQLISYMRSKGYKPQNLVRKQGFTSRAAISNKISNSDEVGNSNNYIQSEHVNQPMASPSAPPYPFIWIKSSHLLTFLDHIPYQWYICLGSINEFRIIPLFDAIPIFTFLLFSIPLSDSKSRLHAIVWPLFERAIF